MKDNSLIIKEYHGGLRESKINDLKTMNDLYRCDAIFLVLTAQHLLSETESSFIENYIKYVGAKRLLLIVNKLDLVVNTEVEHVLDYIEKQIALKFSGVEWTVSGCPKNYEEIVDNYVSSDFKTSVKMLFRENHDADDTSIINTLKYIKEQLEIQHTELLSLEKKSKVERDNAIKQKEQQIELEKAAIENAKIEFQKKRNNTVELIDEYIKDQFVDVLSKIESSFLEAPKKYFWYEKELDPLWRSLAVSVSKRVDCYAASKTQSFTKGITLTKSESTTNTFGVGIGMMGNMGAMSSDSTNVSKNVFSTLKNAMFGGPVAMAAVSGLSQAIGANFGLNVSRAKQEGTSKAKNESEQVGSQDTEQKSHAIMSQQTTQKGVTTGSSTSSMVKYENKLVKVFLECIDDHLKRLKECENYGMWSSAAYFISPSRETSIISASTYKGIINGEGTSLEATSINTWFNDDKTKFINQYLRYFAHPRFYDEDYLSDFSAATDITPSTMLSTKELSVQCNVPYKSIPGVYVREMVGFGRNVFDNEDDDKLHIGQIYHMGKVYEDHDVNLQLSRLREHTFITGSTGSGKSNTTYEIIARLNGLEERGKLTGKSLKKTVPTLVIEPAKGEYKQIFGNSFNVFGTHPDCTELLRINPFKFDKKIHVLEHIDRLIDIFNVCWPMYAAMPAVLKEAVEDAYQRCGWDLNMSANSSGYDIYPNFGDLLISLRNVIKSSDYSQEVKDNYTGSLITRVKSLANGLNGQIFTSNEIDNHRLFEESTIIDLSRVGSSETKSMIMGIIVMRLQERRMAQGGINRDLQHVTILEEAHNLLKKTSTEQSIEGGNLQGKSVEMISNAIAEMRTYGEGFIIVDQAPGLLDMSAIRNTNTKIILHLPDMSDRELVGRAAGLTDDQLIELAKLPSGVAAIYQNKWVEPVLCNIDYYNVSPTEYGYSPQQRKDILGNSVIRTKVALHLVSILSGKADNVDVERLKEWLIASDIASTTKLDALRIFNSKNLIKKAQVEKVIANLVDGDCRAFEIAKDTDSVEEWNATLIQKRS